MHPKVVGNCLVYIYQFVTFTYSLRKTIYPKNRQTIYKKTGNVDMYDERRDF